ncbi:MAG: hypothetical protein KAT56_05930 [Sedimentisphaerales bacterium]|nr:hypothetical protein [Sedimentisphaerales bacterium]
MKYYSILIVFTFMCWPMGCGYSTGNLYRTDVETVFIPIFESQSFRRQVEFEITGALARQIELNTPYKVVSNRSEADTILYGRILGIGETVLTQQRQLDRPLENKVVLKVNVIWKDLRNSELLVDNQTFQVSGDYAVLLGAGSGSAVRKGANDLAVRIVEKMEKTW